MPPLGLLTREFEGALEASQPPGRTGSGVYNDGMATHADVIIVGGGVIGLTTAYYLAKQGVAVSILDRGDLGREASWAGAGIIPPGNVARARTPFDRLRAVSAATFPDLSRALLEETGIDNGYLPCGGIELIEDDEPSIEPWLDEGIAFQAMSNAELKRLAPGLSAEAGRGYFLPGMAQVRNPRHLKALIAACELLAVGLVPSSEVFSLVRQGDRVSAVETEEGRVAGGKFLIAAGAWTDELLAPHGWRPGVRPIRGQIALLKSVRLELRSILLQGKCYLVPRGDGLVLVGATEEDAGFNSRPTAGGIAGLLAFAERLVPGLAEAYVERCWAGLRPGSPDGLPFLGMVPGFSNLFVAAGHFRSGIQLSPATGLMMTDLLTGQQPTVPLAPFRLDRPSAPAGQTAFRS
jgi:glycine oxidase